MYADDTTLFSTIQLSNTCPTKDIKYNQNLDFNKINEWLKINKLSLNVKNSKYIIHKLGNKQVNNLLLKIDKTVIERVQICNLLGVTLQENLSWYVHIKNKFQLNVPNLILNNIKLILNKLKRLLPLNIKVTLYNALMLPYINCGLMVWGFSCNRIIKLQKKASRIICLIKYNAHTEPLFKKLKILNVTDMLKLHELKLYYKYVHTTLPVYLQNLPFILNKAMMNPHI